MTRARLALMASDLDLTEAQAEIRGLYGALDRANKRILELEAANALLNSRLSAANRQVE